jgi:hypothetical protein
MKCFYHPQSDAVAQCSNCQKGICSQCAFHIGDEFGTCCPGCLREDALREIPKARRRITGVWVFTALVTVVGTIAAISSGGVAGILLAPVVFAAAWCFYWGWPPVWGWFRSHWFAVWGSWLFIVIVVTLFFEILVFVALGIGLFTGIQKYRKNKSYIPFAEQRLAEMNAIIGQPMSGGTA